MIGRTIAHYEIWEKLGEGGMGVVYRAYDVFGDPGLADEAAHSTLDLDSSDPNYTKLYHANAQRILGNLCFDTEPKAAEKHYDLALAAGYHNRLELENDPDLAAMRADPRYLELLQRLD